MRAIYEDGHPLKDSWIHEGKGRGGGALCATPLLGDGRARACTRGIVIRSGSDGIELIRASAPRRTWTKRHRSARCIPYAAVSGDTLSVCIRPRK